jgi:hypothetical protein
MRDIEPVAIEGKYSRRAGTAAVDRSPLCARDHFASDGELDARRRRVGRNGTFTVDMNVGQRRARRWIRWTKRGRAFRRQAGHADQRGQDGAVRTRRRLDAARSRPIRWSVMHRTHRTGRMAARARRPVGILCANRHHHRDRRHCTELADYPDGRQRSEQATQTRHPDHLTAEHWACQTPTFALRAPAGKPGAVGGWRSAPR